MWRTQYAAEVTPEDLGKPGRLAGWIEESRNLGKIAFLILRDRTGTFQATVIKSKVGDELFDRATGLNRESVIAIDGELKANDKVRNGWELLPAQIHVLNEAAAPLPLGVVDRVNIELDTRLDHRFMDLRRPGPRAIFRIRSGVLGATHDFLRSQGFLEIHTSNLIGSSSEGGTEVFKLRYFDRDAYLSQSPQLYKQAMMATGFDRVYEIARYFRAEKSDTVRHLSEITGIDLEMAFVEDEEEVMHLIEGLMTAIWTHVADEHADDLAALEKEVPIPKRPFLRITYDDALARLEEAGVKLTWGADLGTEQEKKLGELLAADGHDFYFITKWPLALKPFYCMPDEPTMDAKRSRAFDLDYRGVELLSGAQRIHDPALLEAGIKRWDLDPKDFQGYLEAFRYGMPPHGGCGIGVERIIMQMLELPNVREAVIFPRDRHRLTP
jgi:aspartyl-tRNA synthetase